MIKKIGMFIMIMFLTVSNMLSSNVISAKTFTEEVNLNDSLEQVENLINQSTNVKDNQIEVDDEIKYELVLKVDKELSKNKEYNVSIAKESNAADYTVIGMTLPTGEVQYSLSKSVVDQNDEGIISELELLNFVFDENLKLSYVYEMKSTLDEYDIVKSSLWINNTLFNSIEKDVSKLINNENAKVMGDKIAEEQVLENNSDLTKQEEYVGTFGLADRWNCTQKCVSSKGVSILVISVMLGICGAVCNPAALAASAGLAGGACYACVNATGIAGFTTVMNCWDKCPY